MGIQINGQTDTVTATDGSINVGGDVTIPGVLTYEDVTNVDSVGIVTAQSGIHVTGGSVGINSTNPSSPLEIYTAASAAWKFRIDTTVSDGAGFYQRSNGDFEVVLRDSSNNVNYIAGTSGALQFVTSGNEKLRITSDGKLGLNYNNPNTIIHAIGNSTVGTSVTCTLQSHDTANATANLELYARDSSNNNEICRIRAASEGTNNVDLQFHTNNTERLRITSAGAVGINTTTPFSPLEIQGDSGTNDARITFTRHGTPSNNSVIGELFYRIGTDSVAGIGAYRESAMDDAYLAFYTQPTSGSYGERLRITSGGKIGVNRSQPQGILHVYTDTLNADNGYNGQNFGIVVETEDGNNDGDEGNGICFTQQYSADAADSGKVRTGAIIGFKDQVTGNFGGGLKFKVQPFGAAPLSTSMTLNKSGNVGIGTESVGDKLVVHQGTDDDIIVRVNGADSTTEFAGLGVGSGYASVVAGGSGTTDTDLVFMTSNQGTEAGRWRINNDGILYNMESGYTYNFKRYQGTMPNLTNNTWSTVANTTTIADAGLWILTFGRFEQSQTGGTQWSVTYVGGPVYLHSANGNDGDTVDVPLYHMGHAQNGSGASCRLTYYSGSAHSTGRVQFRPNGWSYTGTNAYYKFYKIADL